MVLDYPSWDLEYYFIKVVCVLVTSIKIASVLNSLLFGQLIPKVR